MILLADFASFMGSVLYIVLAFVVLLFMITIHELGHYTAGKLLGFKINEFAIGMGPKLYSKKMKSGEIFSIRAFPLGGFCAFEGEDEENASEKAFNNQKPWKRLITLFSGALFNFISAIIIVIIAFSCFGDYLPTVDKVIEEGPNYSSGVFQNGDILLKIDGQTIYLYNDVSYIISKGEIPRSVEVVVLRDGVKTTLSNVMIDKYGVEDANLGFGIMLGTKERTKFNLGDAITRSVPYCVRVGSYVLETVGGLITGLIGLDSIGGPISTIDITSQVVKSGFANILFLISLISVNLAVFNLLPLPALDGSRMIFVIVEWIRGKPINRKIEGIIHLVGIITLFVFVIVVDLIKYLL